MENKETPIQIFVSYKINKTTFSLIGMFREVRRFVDFRNSIFHTKTIYLNSKKSDSDFLLNDWKTVGNDIQISIQKFKNENVIENRPKKEKELEKVHA